MMMQGHHTEHLRGDMKTSPPPPPLRPAVLHQVRHHPSSTSETGYTCYKQEHRKDVVVSLSQNIFMLFFFFLSPELPGFYFDPEKNRYFRLLPGHNNCNPLTREQLQEKEREKQRSKMLAEDEKPRKVSLLSVKVLILLWLLG